jgi:ABC-2 type transport system ATP-binding protein
MLVEVEGISVEFGGVPILRDVSLSLREGEIYGLLGPNGAGKSTTMAVVAGLLATCGGRVRVAGMDPLAKANRIHGLMGMVPEHNGFYDWMTAEGYLRFFVKLHGRDLGHTALRERLDRVGLSPQPRQRIGTFSRGMRQRLGLARALINDPRLLILDEPTSGLDPRGRRDIDDILIDLSRNHGVGILMCTHLLDDVDRLCRRIGIISNGATVAEGDIDDLLAARGSLARFQLHLSGDPPDAKLPLHTHLVAREGEWCVIDLDPSVTADAAWRELLFMGWPVTEIRREGGGLEALYLNVTEQRVQ